MPCCLQGQTSCHSHITGGCRVTAARRRDMENVQALVLPPAGALMLTFGSVCVPVLQPCSWKQHLCLDCFVLGTGGGLPGSAVPCTSSSHPFQRQQSLCCQESGGPSAFSVHIFLSMVTEPSPGLSSEFFHSGFYGIFSSAVSMPPSPGYSQQLLSRLILNLNAF